MVSAALFSAVLIASVWHPLQANSRSAASSAGLRLAAALICLVAFFYVPHWFDSGVAGQDTSTCPFVMNSHSTAWWVSVVLLGGVWWLAVGVLKASGLSIHRDERHAIAVLTATLTAVGVAAFGLLAFALSTVCP